MFLRLLILCLVLFVIELYAYQALRTVVKAKPILISYQIISALLLAYIVYSFTQFDRKIGQTPQTMQTMGLLLMVYLPKIILTLVLFGEDIYRIGFGSVNHFAKFNDSVDFLSSRRKFISQIGLGLAAVPFLSLIYS